MPACWALVAVAIALGAASTSRAQGISTAASERATQIVTGRCFLCHGAQGEAATELFPRLAAQNAAYIAKQLANFKSGARKSDSMQPQAAPLSEEDMRAIGEYFSRQRVAPHAVSDATLAAAGRTVYRQGGKAPEVSACMGCHGERGHGAENMPRLAGQVAAYLETQLRQFGNRTRTNDNAVMQVIASKMTEREIKAVAEYLSTLD